MAGKKRDPIMLPSEAAKIIFEEMIFDVKDIVKRLRIFHDRYQQYGKQFAKVLPAEYMEEKEKEFMDAIREMEEFGG